MKTELYRIIFLLCIISCHFRISGQTWVSIFKEGDNSYKNEPVMLIKDPNGKYFIVDNACLCKDEFDNLFTCSSNCEYTSYYTFSENISGDTSYSIALPLSDGLFPFLFLGSGYGIFLYRRNLKRKSNR